MANYYQILGIPNFSSSAVVKKSFRRLALQYHPDKHKGKTVYEEKFKEINRAYQVLNNPEKKSFYDQQLLYGLNQIRSAQRTTNPPTRGPEPREVKKTNPYRVKREKVKHSPFQIVFIKVALSLTLILTLISIGVNLTDDQTPHPAQELHNRYLAKKEAIERDIEQNRFDSAILNLDTLELLHGLNPDDEFLKKKLLFYFESRLDADYLSFSDAQAITQIKAFRQLSLRFNQPFSSKWELKLLTHQLRDSSVEDQLSLINHFNAEQLKLTEQCVFTDLLLIYGFKDQAFERIKSNTKAIFQQFYNQLGLSYYERLKEMDIQPDVFKELIQFCLVNAQTDNQPFESLHDWITFKLASDKGKKTFRALQQNAFSQESLSILNATKDGKTFIEAYDLTLFLEN